MPLVTADNPGNPVAIALRNYRNIKTYQVTLRSKSHASLEEIRYYYKSAYIRMEFISLSLEYSSPTIRSKKKSDSGPSGLQITW